MESKFKESEVKRGSLIFEHEKERAKWEIERDHLLSQKNDLFETVNRLERKKELMLRENEKLRNDHRYARKVVNSSFLGAPLHHLQNSTNSMKKRGITEQIDKNSLFTLTNTNT